MSIKTKASNTKILFVDDDQDFLTQNYLRFTSLGFQVFKASSQKEAEQVFSESKPDLVVLDLMMEEKDAGMILAHHFKKQVPTLPILMVTGITRECGIMLDNSNPEDKKWLKADKIIAKPVKFEQLKREIDLLLKK